MQDVLAEYRACINQKAELDRKLHFLEKEYLKALVNSCQHNETVCDNCWAIVPIVKGKTAHTLDGHTPLCKKRSLEQTIRNTF